MQDLPSEEGIHELPGEQRLYPHGGKTMRTVVTTESFLARKARSKRFRAGLAVAASGTPSFLLEAKSLAYWIAGKDVCTLVIIARSM